MTNEDNAASSSSARPFNADGITPNNWQPMDRVRKRPVEVHATRLMFPEGFTVTTMEGVMRGKPGDWLIIGVAGERYPCDDAVFRRTYDIIGRQSVMQLTEHDGLNRLKKARDGNPC